MSPDTTLEAALDALRRDLVIGLPTDTVYGIAAAPHSEDGVRRLFRLKGRPAGKPVPILAADVAAVSRVAVLEGDAAAAARRYWPGALTLVLPRADGLPEWIGDPAGGTVAVRIPAHDVVLAVLRAAGPLAVTSANSSGAPPVVDDAGARGIFGDGVAVYLKGRSGGDVASTVVDFAGPEPRVLRRGPVEVAISD